MKNGGKILDGQRQIAYNMLTCSWPGGDPTKTIEVDNRRH